MASLYNQPPSPPPRIATPTLDRASTPYLAHRYQQSTDRSRVHAAAVTRAVVNKPALPGATEHRARASGQATRHMSTCARQSHGAAASLASPRPAFSVDRPTTAPVDWQAMTPLLHDRRGAEVTPAPSMLPSRCATPAQYGQQHGQQHWQQHGQQHWQQHGQQQRAPGGGAQLGGVYTSQLHGEQVLPVLLGPDHEKHTGVSGQLGVPSTRRASTNLGGLTGTRPHSRGAVTKPQAAIPQSAGGNSLSARSAKAEFTVFPPDDRVTLGRVNELERRLARAQDNLYRIRQRESRALEVAVSRAAGGRGGGGGGSGGGGSCGGGMGSGEGGGGEGGGGEGGGGEGGSPGSSHAAAAAAVVVEGILSDGTSMGLVVQGGGSGGGGGGGGGSGSGICTTRPYTPLSQSSHPSVDLVGGSRPYTPLAHASRPTSAREGAALGSTVEERALDRQQRELATIALEREACEAEEGILQTQLDAAREHGVCLPPLTSAYPRRATNLVSCIPCAFAKAPRCCLHVLPSPPFSHSPRSNPSLRMPSSACHPPHANAFRTSRLELVGFACQLGAGQGTQSSAAAVSSPGARGTERLARLVLVGAPQRATCGRRERDERQCDERQCDERQWDERCGLSMGRRRQRHWWRRIGWRRIWWRMLG